jgi:predicted dithiol-disulfide oxidoreductase (DUF899 family)
MGAMPRVTSLEEWQQERAALMKEEKEATRFMDAIAAKRRRLPMVKFDGRYAFTTPDGPMTILDFFDGRVQLAVYQFMDNGPDAFCPGCTHLTNNVRCLPDVLDNGVSWRTVSEMPLAQMEEYWAKKGWDVPFASSLGTPFIKDCGGDGSFMFTIFFRDGDDVYRTYNTTGRGMDPFLFPNTLLDHVPYGRQEAWEDSPQGWPQHPTYG